MKKVYIKINDILVKNCLKDIFLKNSLAVVNDEKDADFVLGEDGDEFVVNNDYKFQKPLNVFDVINFLQSFALVSFCGASFDINKKIVVRDGAVVQLTDIETKILSRLLDEEDGVDVEDLVCGVFGKNTESNVKTLSTHIYNLKKKLALLFKKQKNIIVVNARYKLDLS